MVYMIVTAILLEIIHFNKLEVVKNFNRFYLKFYHGNKEEMPSLNKKEVTFISNKRRSSIAPADSMEHTLYENSQENKNLCPSINCMRRYLGCDKYFKIYNTSGNIINVIIKPSLTQLVKKVSLQRVGTLELDTEGEYKNCELNIPNDHFKKVFVDTTSFYLTLRVFHKNTWRCVYSDRRFRTSEDIYVKDSILDSIEINDDNRISDEDHTEQMKAVVLLAMNKYAEKLAAGS